VPDAHARIASKNIKNASVVFTNAKQLGFPTGTFDLALSGFMGWYDCYDFEANEFTQPEEKAKEIHRVLQEGGRFVCCSWEMQEGLRWMEDAVVHHYPEILEDEEYLRRRPIGMAYEKAEGYQVILESAGFRQIEVEREKRTFISTDEEEWWRQMLYLGWESLIEKMDAERLSDVKDAIFRELQIFKQEAGIHFDKAVFYVKGVK
jgi:ubiquinone/menaquinone biosynthesis C-methylase UbiE